MLYIESSEINFNRIGMISPLASNNNQSRGRSPTINLEQNNIHGKTSILFIHFLFIYLF